MSDPYYNMGTPDPGDDDWPRRRNYQLHPDAAALLQMLGYMWNTLTPQCTVIIYKPGSWSAWTPPVPSYEDVARLVTMWDEKAKTLVPGN